MPKGQMSSPPLSSKVSGIELSWGNQVTVNEQGDIEVHPVVELVVLWVPARPPLGTPAIPSSPGGLAPLKIYFPFRPHDYSCCCTRNVAYKGQALGWEGRLCAGPLHRPGGFRLC